MPSIDELFEKMVPQKPRKGTKKAAPKIPTGGKAADPLKAAVNSALRQERTKQRERRGYQSGNGTDYKKVWNETTNKFDYITRARYEMARILGRPVAEHERVFFRDKTLKGDAKFAPENLVLGFKSGVPLDMLTCKNCGCRGNWEVNPVPNGEERDSE